MNYQELLYTPLIPSQILPFIQKASRHNFPVLIQGEPGTGKELVAKIIHHIGGFKLYRFHKIDCKMLTEEEPRDQFSRFLQGVEGERNPFTLYLKEIEHLGPFNQLNLLRMMDDGIFPNGLGERVGDSVRFIASSSDSLREKVIQRKFSEDLYHRFNPLSIHMPPLRERVQEIPSISQYLLSEYAQKIKRDKISLSDPVQKLLETYGWPGNLTELEQVLMRSALLSEGEILWEKDLLTGAEDEKNSFTSFLKKAGVVSSSFKEKDRRNESNNLMSPPFLIELVHRIKNPLVSIKTFTQLLKEKFNDAEFKEYFYKIVTEDIEKIDSLLNLLLNYIRINTPVPKTNTVHHVLEDILKSYQGVFDHHQIKLIKRFEKDLPETTLHDEQMRYIFNAILQYAIPITPPNGSIGFLTKSFQEAKKTNGHQTPTPKGDGYLEIWIVFTGYKKSVEQFETVLGIPPTESQRAIELELRLVKEMIEKNGGTMKLKANENNPQTFISLQFPIERRKTMYYQPTI